MSVTPHTPANLPPMNGKNLKDFEYDLDNLPEGLRFLQDKPTHGLIEPSRPMKIEVFQQLIHNTGCS